MTHPFGVVYKKFHLTQIQRFSHRCFIILGSALRSVIDYMLIFNVVWGSNNNALFYLCAYICSIIIY